MSPTLAEILQDQNPWWGDPAVRRARRYPVRRSLQPEILARLLRLEDRRAVLLLGPRQVGKTVLLLQVADDLLAAGWPAQNLTYFDFSDDRLTVEVSPRQIEEIQPVGLLPDHPRVFLLDEIRSAVKWDLWLKQAVDRGGARIAATDSAASLLRDGSRESGQGRWDELRLEGLSFIEFIRLWGGPEEDEREVLRRVPNLHERYLAAGGFPEHAVSDEYPEVRRRLRSDIADRAIQRDLSGFDVDVQRVKDLFVYLVQDSGAVFDAASRGRDLGADPRSVRDWARLLLDTLLVSELEPRTLRASAALRAKRKVFAADHGLVTAFATLPTREPRVRAQAFEAVVFRHLREVARGLGGTLSYFRKDDDLEIDFVVDVGGDPIGIEVTSSSRLRPEKADRLRRAGGALGAGRLLLVHGGLVEEEAGKGIRPVPLPRFLLDAAALVQGGGD